MLLNQVAGEVDPKVGLWVFTAKAVGGHGDGVLEAALCVEVLFASMVDVVDCTADGKNRPVVTSTLQNLAVFHVVVKDGCQVNGWHEVGHVLIWGEDLVSLANHFSVNPIEPIGRVEVKSLEDLFIWLIGLRRLPSSFLLCLEENWA